MSPKPLDWINKIKLPTWISPPELFVILVLLLFGSFLAFRVPLGAGFDEETHLLRVWEMSSFVWIPNERLSTDMHFPAFYWDNSYRRQALLEPIDPNFWATNSKTPIDSLGLVPESLTTRSVYSPLLLLPQSLVMFLFGRVLNLPALTVLIAVRMIGLLSYTLLVWWAVRLAPFGKWLWAVFVLAPMAVYQASTVTTDTISNGIGFLFVSGCLLIASRAKLRWKNWLFLIFLFLLLFSAKVNLVPLAVLPFLIIRPSQFKMPRGYFLLLVGAILLALIEVGGWNILAYSRFYTALPGADPKLQLVFLATHPIAGIGIFLSDLWFHLPLYIKGWIADYGYGYWGPPWFIYPIYIIALAACFFINKSSRPNKKIRLGLLITFSLAFLVTLLSLYVSYTPVGSSEIQGVHGRYFTVIIPLLLISVYGLLPELIKISESKTIALATGLVFLTLFFFSIAGYTAYYVRCGTQFYRSGLCYQPVYKNWSPNSVYFQPISSTYTLTQWIIPKCNGMSTVRVWVDSSGSSQNNATEFILNDEANDTVVVDRVIPNGDLPQEGWLALDFPSDQSSGGKWFTLTIQEPSSDQGLGASLASSIQPEYLDGPLFQKGVEIDNDVIFQYGCTAGWKPLFTRIIAIISKR